MGMRSKRKRQDSVYKDFNEETTHTKVLSAATAQAISENLRIIGVLAATYPNMRQAQKRVF